MLCQFISIEFLNFSVVCNVGNLAFGNNRRESECLFKVLLLQHYVLAHRELGQQLQLQLLLGTTLPTIQYIEVIVCTVMVTSNSPSASLSFCRSWEQCVVRFLNRFRFRYKEKTSCHCVYIYRLTN